MICIVSGPSCSGKSTFLHSDAAAEHSRQSPMPPVVFPKDIIRHRQILAAPCFVHYNILRPANALASNWPGTFSSYTDFRADSAWQLISASTQPKTAVVLVAGRSVLHRRMTLRKRIGESYILNIFNPRYKSGHWTSLLDSVDMGTLYSAWLDELKRINIIPTLVDAADPSWRHLDMSSFNPAALNA